MANSLITPTIKLVNVLGNQLDFKIMFERATIFSALFILIIFGILGTKYMDYMVAKAQGNGTAVTSTQ